MLHAHIADLFTVDDRTVLGGQIAQERRTLTASRDLTGYRDWPGLDQVLRPERHRLITTSGKATREVRYGLPSLPPDRASAADLPTLAATPTCASHSPS